MAKNDQQEAFERVLSGNLSRAIEFIKYGEAKNAALLTFCSAWILALSTMLANYSFPVYGAYTSTISCICFLSCAGVSSILSFLPKTAVGYFIGSNNRSRNMLFVGDIESILLPDLEAALEFRYKPADGDAATPGFLTDLVQQIGINSRIAMNKFRSFNRGALLTLLGLAALSLPYLVQGVKLTWLKIGT